MTDDINNIETGRVAPAYNDQKEEWRWHHEMADRLSRYRHERRYNSRTPPPSALDIDVRAYEIVRSIECGSYRTWGKILPAIIDNRETLSSAGRRVLLRTMREAAMKLRRDAERAELRARRYDWLIAQLEVPFSVKMETERRNATVT